jgi:chromosome segregation ATPase
VNSDYSIPRELDDHPEVKSARDLWANLRHRSPVAAPHPAAIHQIEELFERRVDYFQNLDAEYAGAQSALKRLQDEFATRTAWALELNAEIERKHKLILQLQDDVKERSDWAMSLNKLIAEKDALLVELQNACLERTNWALGLQAELDRKAVEIGGLHREVAELKENIKATGA